MKRLTLFTVAALLAACGDTPTEAPTQVAPSFGIANAPGTSGIVTRGEDLLGLTWVDFNTGLRIAIGFDPVEFCMGAPAFDIAPVQNLDLGDGRIVGLLQGHDLTTSVWGFLPIDCGRFLTEDPAGSGVADLIYTDNDLDGDRPNRQNANVWGFRAHGTLSTPSGGRARLSAHQTVLYPEPGGPFGPLNSVVKLTY